MNATTALQGTPRIKMTFSKLRLFAPAEDQNAFLGAPVL
jgi:hypothetical protein